MPLIISFFCRKSERWHLLWLRFWTKRSKSCCGLPEKWCERHFEWNCSCSLEKGIISILFNLFITFTVFQQKFVNDQRNGRFLESMASGDANLMSVILSFMNLPLIYCVDRKTAQSPTSLLLTYSDVWFLSWTRALLCASFCYHQYSSYVYSKKLNRNESDHRGLRRSEKTPYQDSESIEM